MEIPKELKIGGHMIKIKIEDDVVRMANERQMGDSWSAYNSIRVCSVYPESQQAETLLHEILHHIMDNLGYEYVETKDVEGKEIHTEQTVEGLAQWLFQVLRDNKLKFYNEEVK